jgi:amidohydrolase
VTRLFDAEQVRAVREQVDRHRDQILGLSHAIAADPELAFEEHRAMARCAELLEKAGLTVERGAYELDTAFAARAGSRGPHVVICAEYDALPEVGHACGHNVIAAAAVGAGLVLAPLAEEVGLRLTVLGTPAEERFGGKVNLLDAGAFDDADAALMVHPTPYDDYAPDSLGIEEWEAVYTGRASHASAEPDLGLNALDGLVAGYTSIAMLRQHLRPWQQVHGIITHGGDAPNIVPERAEGLFYLRARTPEDLEDLRARVRACLDGAATSTGTTVEVTPVGSTYLPLRPHDGLAAAFTAACEALGRPLTPDPRGRQPGGSTDLGNVSQRLPGLHANMAVHSWPAVNHQHEFAAHCTTDAADRTLLDAAAALALTAYTVTKNGLDAPDTSDAIASLE